MPIEPQNLWNFSLDLYDREGVASACLNLQDEFGFDVNLILFCLWFAEQHGKVDQKLMRAAVQLSNDWRSDIVQPLRIVRRRLKAGANKSQAIDELREDIKAAELAAEKLQQEQIEALAQQRIKELTPQKLQGAREANIQSLLDELKITKIQRIDSLLNPIIEKLEGDTSI